MEVNNSVKFITRTQKEDLILKLGATQQSQDDVETADSITAHRKGKPYNVKICGGRILLLHLESKVVAYQQSKAP